MATPMHPASMMDAGPPAAPPEMPTLSAMPQGDPGPPMPGQVGAFPELFFNTEQQLKLLAKTLPPQYVPELEEISVKLRAVMIKALQSGASAASSSPTMGPQPTSSAGPVGPRPESL